MTQTDEQVTARVPAQLLEDMDEQVAAEGYVSRAEFVRACVRAVLYGDAEPVGEPMADLKRLLGEGLSPTNALDYMMVVQRGRTRTEWAATRGTSHQAVAESVSRAEEELAEGTAD